MAKVMGVLSFVLGIVTLGWWTRMRQRQRRATRGEDQKRQGRADWQSRRIE